ncbi:MAG: HAMP domain-containing protein [Mucilaginibacter sp.]
MKIKKKLLLGFGLLFIVVLVLGSVSLYYIEVISKTSSSTLKNNYETLTFTREMRMILDQNTLPLPATAAGNFDSALKKQENNITEQGEKEATAGVRSAFAVLVNSASNVSQQQDAQKRIRTLLNGIDGLNMSAIVRKNLYTHDTVEKATLYLGAVGFITFIIIFILIANFPGFILDPLDALADGLQEIGNHNYNARLDLKTSEEFTMLSQAFNTMATELGNKQNTNLTKIRLADLRIKALINAMEDGVIGVNEKSEILFMNAAAMNLAHPGPKGKDSAESLNLLKRILACKNSDSPVSIDVDGVPAYFTVQTIEINAPNLKPNPTDVVQYSEYPAGMVIILRNMQAAVKL